MKTRLLGGCGQLQLYLCGGFVVAAGLAGIFQLCLGYGQQGSAPRSAAHMVSSYLGNSCTRWVCYYLVNSCTRWVCLAINTARLLMVASLFPPSLPFLLGVMVFSE